MAHPSTTIACHLETASQTELIVYHMSERHTGVLVDWHCAKVKGHTELNIEKRRVN